MPSKAILASGNPFVLALCDALGLPKETIAFDLHCEAGKAVTVRCTFLPQSYGVEGFDPRPLTRSYMLVEASGAVCDGTAQTERDELDVTSLSDESRRFAPE